jgi:hypothetical protein
VLLRRLHRVEVRGDQRTRLVLRGHGLLFGQLQE